MKNLILIVLLSIAIGVKLAAQCENVNCSGTTAGTNASAIGTNTEASGYSAFASGNLAIASGEVSTAIGGNVTSSAPSAITIGRFLLASGTRSVVIGSGKDNNLHLINGIPHTLMIGFDSDKPTFFVSATPNGYQSGRIGIGNVTDPQAKLHIRADSADDATLRLEPGIGKVSRIFFSNTNDYYVQAANNQNMIFNALKGNHYEFKNGTLRGINGTAQTPAYSFSSSNNTGIYLPGTSTLAFSTSGTERVRISNTGNVGIGTSTLNNRLEVNGLVNTTNGYKVGNIEVINSSRDYFGSNGNLSGNLSVTGSTALTGNVGIGTNFPQSKLHVNGNAYFLSDDSKNQLQILFSGTTIPARRGIKLTNDPDGAFNFYIHGNQEPAAFNFIDGRYDNTLMTIKKDGSVGIATTTTIGYKLAVAGKILAEELQIQMVQDWYDNVFKEEYNLMDLYELESFVKQNNHLPDIPSEAEVKENGIRVGEMNALLLKKVEELTLYIIEQQKMLEHQHNKIENLKHLFTSKNNQ